MIFRLAHHWRALRTFDIVLSSCGIVFASFLVPRLFICCRFRIRRCDDHATMMHTALTPPTHGQNINCHQNTRNITRRQHQHIVEVPSPPHYISTSLQTKSKHITSTSPAHPQLFQSNTNTASTPRQAHTSTSRRHYQKQHQSIARTSHQPSSVR